jgi:hypothetical protein
MNLSIVLKTDTLQAILSEPSGNEFKIIEATTLKRDEFKSFVLGKKIKKIRISINSEDILHEIFHLPPARPRLISKLVERELAGLISEEFQYKFEILGDIREEEHLKRRVSVVAIPRQLLEGAIPHPKSPIEWITSYPVSIGALLNNLKLPEGGLAFLELASDAVDILIFKGKELRVVRRLPPLLSEDDVGNLIRDLLQTTFFYKQKYQGESVEGIIVTGEKFSESIVDILNRDLEMTVITLDELPEVARKLPGAYGNLLVDPRSPYLFIPESLKKRRLLERISLGLSLFALIAFTIEAHRILSKEAELRLNLKYMNNLERVIREREAGLAQLKREVIEYQVKEAQPEWRNIFLEMAAIVPEGVFLKNLNVRRENGKYIGEATGEIERGDPLEKVMILNLLRKRLSLSPLILNPVLGEEIEGDKVTFTIRFVLPSGESVR